MKTRLLGGLSVLFFVACGDARAETVKQPEGIAFEALRIESRVFPKVDATESLRGLVDDAARRIKRSMIELQSTNSLSLIHRAIFDHGFVLKSEPKQQLSLRTLSDSLIAKKLDCWNLTIIYEEVASVCGIKLSCGYGLDHIYVIMPLPDRNLYWEATKGQETSLLELCKRMDNRAAAVNGTYFEPCDSRTLLSAVYLGIAFKLYDGGTYEDAGPFIVESIVQYPRLVNSWNLLSDLRQKQKRYADAEQAALEALRLDPGYVTACQNLCLTYKASNDRAKELQALERLLTLSKDKWFVDRYKALSKNRAAGDTSATAKKQ